MGRLNPLLHVVLVVSGSLAPLSPLWGAGGGEREQWPDAALCKSLQRDPSGSEKSVASLLQEQADLVLTQVASAALRERLMELRAKNRFQEIIWELARAGEEKPRARMETALYCFLLEAPVAKLSTLEGSSTESKHVYFADLGIEGVFKPKQHNYSASVGAEVGAYRVDRLLELNIVPITLRRRIAPDGVDGSLQYFVKDCITGSKLPANKQSKTAELLFFDYFSKNIDRDPKNYLLLSALDKIVAIDNGWCLRGNNVFAKVKAAFVDKRTPEEKKLLFPDDRLPSGELVNRLRRLNAERIHAALSGTLNSRAIEKLIKRRTKLLRAIDAQGASRESSVMPADQRL